jgi:hypothetical protein
MRARWNAAHHRDLEKHIARGLELADRAAHLSGAPYAETEAMRAELLGLRASRERDPVRRAAILTDADASRARALQENPLIVRQFTD